ncbi:hypothetical protein AA0111_g12694 [Alternaria arborescens]|uniref:hypothetical protein n=1 Tax=Alternaria arborescens TaxID=156630 RepID=UPI0010756948|nr:hypothetical protein AA0111_g12694 [Alternaria arborescens]RYO11940.1 hypothetical protein AA0111_g12694 [Alternaria arborescens]
MASSFSSSSVGQGPNQRQSEHFEWLIVTEKKRGHVVYSVEMHHRMTGTTAVHAIRKAFKDTKPSNPWFHSRAQLEDVVLSSFTVNPDPEAQDYPRAVILKSSTPLLELTEAFHTPSLLNGTGATLIRENSQFNPANGKSLIDGHYHAILIKTKASRWLIAAGVAGTIVVEAVIGSVVGYMVGNAELGVAAGATAIAVFAFIQGCLLFLK